MPDGIPVSFYDLDTQGGTPHKTHEADGVQVAVVDTPGALQKGLADWLKEADVEDGIDSVTTSTRGVGCKP